MEYLSVFLLTINAFILGKFMSTVEEVKSVLSDIQSIVINVSSDVDSLIAQVAALKAQIDSGTVVSQADLDAIAASAQSIKDTLASVDAKEPAPVA